jgi:hypothetical protein
MKRKEKRERRNKEKKISFYFTKISMNEEQIKSSKTFTSLGPLD